MYPYPLSVGNGSQFLALSVSIILLALMGMFNVHRWDFRPPFVVWFHCTTLHLPPFYPPLTPFQTSLDELSCHLALCLYLLCLWLCLCQTVPKAGRTQLGLERGPHGKPICSTILRCVEPGQFSCLVPQLHSGPPLYHHHSHLVHLGYR